MIDWQQRVVEEREALEPKVAKLEYFVHSAMYEELDEVDKILLSLQLKAMRMYLWILNTRVNKF